MKKPLLLTACLTGSALLPQLASAKTVCRGSDLAWKAVEFECSSDSCRYATISDVKITKTLLTDLQKSCWNVPQSATTLKNRLTTIKRKVLSSPRSAYGVGTGRYSDAREVLMGEIAHLFDDALVDE